MNFFFFLTIIAFFNLQLLWCRMRLIFVCALPPPPLHPKLCGSSQKRGAVPIVFTASSTQSADPTQEALRASGCDTNIYPSVHTHAYARTHQRHTHTRARVHAHMHTLRRCRWTREIFRSRVDEGTAVKIPRCRPDSDLFRRDESLSLAHIFILPRPPAVVVGQDGERIQMGPRKCFPFSEAMLLKHNR